MCIGNLVFEQHVKAIKGHFEFPAGDGSPAHSSRAAIKAPPIRHARQGWRAQKPRPPASNSTLAFLACQSKMQISLDLGYPRNTFFLRPF